MKARQLAEAFSLAVIPHCTQTTVSKLHAEIARKAHFLTYHMELDNLFLVCEHDIKRRDSVFTLKVG